MAGVKVRVVDEREARLAVLQEFHVFIHLNHSLSLTLVFQGEVDTVASETLMKFIAFISC